MLQKEVYLFERIDTAKSNERMKHLKCLVFIRPTKNNIAFLCHELRNPRFGSYYICMRIFFFELFAIFVLYFDFKRFYSIKMTTHHSFE